MFQRWSQHDDYFQESSCQLGDRRRCRSPAVGQAHCIGATRRPEDGAGSAEATTPTGDELMSNPARSSRLRPRAEPTPSVSGTNVGNMAVTRVTRMITAAAVFATLSACGSGGTSGVTKRICGKTISTGSVSSAWYVDLSKGDSTSYRMQKNQSTWFRIMNNCSSGIKMNTIPPQTRSHFADKILTSNDSVLVVLVRSGNGPGAANFNLPVSRNNFRSNIEISLPN